MNTENSILILGASTNPNRTSYAATKYLYKKGYNLFAFSHKKGTIDNVPLYDDSQLSLTKNIETITLFLNPDRQKKYYEYILSIKPKRIIFNPGTENPELIQLAIQHKIQVITGCTIAMISNGFI